MKDVITPKQSTGELKLSRKKLSRSPLSAPTEPSLLASIKDFDDASETSKDITPTKAASQPMKRGGSAEGMKPTTADRLIDELVRQNANAIKLERQAASGLINDSQSSSSSITNSRRKLPRNRAGQVSQNRIPQRLDPVARIRREESAPRYSTNQRNSKHGSITPSIEPIIIPK